MPAASYLGSHTYIIPKISAVENGDHATVDPATINYLVAKLHEPISLPTNSLLDQLLMTAFHNKFAEAGGQ